MKTKHEKYLNDPMYKRLVDILFRQIIECNFTPSELSEAAVYAAIKYEMEIKSTTLESYMRDDLNSSVVSITKEK